MLNEECIEMILTGTNVGWRTTCRHTVTYATKVWCMNELSKSSLCRTRMGPLTVRTGFLLSSVGVQRFLFLRRKPRGPRAGATPPSVALRRLEAALSDAPQPGNASRRSYPCLGRTSRLEAVLSDAPQPGNASRKNYPCLGRTSRLEAALSNVV